MLKKWLRELNKIMPRDTPLVILLALSAIYFLTYYFTDPNIPPGILVAISGHAIDATTPMGWFGFWDQSQYLGIAHALAGFDFKELRGVYHYGLGYPIVAVPTLWLGLASDPFLPFNLAVFLFAVYAVYKVAKKIISPTAAWIAGFGLVFATPLVQYVVQPWNSTVCLLAISGILLVASNNKITKWHGFCLGLLVGWAFAARYVDIIWLSVLAVAALYRHNVRSLLQPLLLFCAGMAIWIAPVAYSHEVFFGSPLRTPYVNHIGIGGKGGSDQGLSAYKLNNIPDAALGMFISPKLAGSKDVDRGWLIEMFWVVAAIPGAMILLRNSRYRLFFATLCVITIAGFIFYLSFRASTPSSLKYGILHYFKMFWPGLVIMAVAFFDEQMRRVSKSKN